VLRIRDSLDLDKRRKENDEDEDDVDEQEHRFVSMPKLRCHHAPGSHFIALASNQL
jgi:hypothetical protein